MHRLTINRNQEPQASPQHVTLSFNPATPVPSTRRILTIDIENFPDWYGGGDFVYDRTFCISHKVVNSSDNDIHTTWIDWTQDDETILQLLQPLWDAMRDAEAFLGHNFRHDWKAIQTVFRDLEQAPLEKRPVVDTMRCIPSGIPRGLDNLCARFDLGEKPHLTNHDWTQALRRRNPEKIALVKYRNRMDVLLTERLYHKEREIGWL